jgi:phage terminase large subunit-like protein
MCKNDPVMQSEILTKTFNLSLNNYLSYFTNEECLGNKEKFIHELFIGNNTKNSRCILGMDLSDVNDICSVSFMIVVGDKRYFLNKKFLPRKTIDNLGKVYQDKYLEWMANDHIHVHDFDHNDQEYIFNYIYDFMQKNNIMPIVIGYDRWNARQIVKLFKDCYGDICVDIPQTVKSLSGGLKIYKSKIKVGKIIFDDPVASFCHMNVMVKTDHNNNIFPSRIKSRGGNKIDVFASQLNAFIAFELEKEKLDWYVN